VKQAATAAGVPVLQPARLRDPDWPERLRALGADVAVVVAFGQILPPAVLEAPARGSINVHASLLPRYRGAAPIQWAIIRGETSTGISTFQMDAGMDTGPVLLRAQTAIGPEETAGELAARLSALGASVLLETLARLDALVPVPQRHEDATLAPRLKKSDGSIDWSRSARDIVNLVRGCNPWPGATTRGPGGGLSIWRARPLSGSPGTDPGCLVGADDVPAIATGDGLVRPLEVQPDNRRPMSWEDYLRGARLDGEARFTAPSP
jgi:methionyl-tRNA formyltransferase